MSSAEHPCKAPPPFRAHQIAPTPRNAPPNAQGGGRYTSMQLSDACAPEQDRPHSGQRLPPPKAGIRSTCACASVPARCGRRGRASTPALIHNAVRMRSQCHVAHHALHSTQAGRETPESSHSVRAGASGGDNGKLARRARGEGTREDGKDSPPPRVHHALHHRHCLRWAPCDMGNGR